MILKCLGSESAGNGYILQSKQDVLLIECGVRLDRVKEALGFDLSRVVGCIISHEHLDHCKYIHDYMKAGIDCYASRDTIEHLKLDGHRLNVVTDAVASKIGSFTVLPFLVPHDVPNYGYLISHPESGKILFVTDAAYIPERFTGLNQIMLEINYEDALLTSDRAIGCHLSLDTALDFLRANDMKGVQNIILLHLSASNSDSKLFAKAVSDVARNAKVYIGDKRFTVELNRYPF